MTYDLQPLRAELLPPPATLYEGYAGDPAVS